MRKEINLSDGMSKELDLLAKRRGLSLKNFIEDICEKVALEGYISPKGLLDFEMTDDDLLERWRSNSRIVKAKKKVRKPLTQERIEAMVDIYKAKYPKGDTRSQSEIEHIFNTERRERYNK